MLVYASCLLCVREYARCSYAMQPAIVLCAPDILTCAFARLPPNTTDMHWHIRTSSVYVNTCEDIFVVLLPMAHCLTASFVHSSADNSANRMDGRGADLDFFSLSRSVVDSRVQTNVCAACACSVRYEIMRQLANRLHDGI